MLKKDILAALKDLPDDYDVKVLRAITTVDWHCGANCMSDPDMEEVDFSLMRELEYNPKTKQQELVGLTFSLPL